MANIRVVPDGRECRVGPQGVTIGSGKHCDLRLTDPLVSPEHCRLTLEDGCVVLNDLQSERGSFVKGSRVYMARLRDHDRFQVGSTTLLVSTAPAKRFDPAFAVAWGAAGVGALLILVVSLLSLWAPSVAVEDYSPKEGAAGSCVLISFSAPIDPNELAISLSGAPLYIAALDASRVAASLPATASSGEIEVSWHGKTVAALPFTVRPARLTVLLEEKLQPSSTSKTVRAENGASLTVPGGLLREAATVTISRVEDPAVHRELPFAEFEVYDLSIEGMAQLSEAVEIGLPYDPGQLASDVPIAAQLEPARWDPGHQLWVGLPFFVDDENATVYLLSDHLSWFTLGSVSFTGLAKAAATVAVVGEVAERWGNDKYLSPRHKVRVLFSDKNLRGTFPDQRWQSVMAPAELRATDYRPDPSYAVQDFALILERTLDCYVKAGFPDPTVKGILGAHLYTRYVKLKIDSYFNRYLQGGEKAHDSFWDTIHLPSELVNKEFYYLIEMGQGSFEEHFTTLKAGLAHELFHAFQVPYYGSLSTFVENEHRWWREATAEWAGYDLAQIPYRSGWDRDPPVLVKRIGPRFFDHPVNSLGRYDGTTLAVGGLDYEYLAAVFVRYLVREQRLDFKKLMDVIGNADHDVDAIVPLTQHLKSSGRGSLNLVYQQFALWLLRASELPLSDVANPKSTKVVAKQIDELRLEEEKTLLRLSFTSPLADESVSVFRERDKVEHLQSGSAPTVVLGERGARSALLLVEDGDILYFLGANGEPAQRTITLDIEVSDDEGGADSWKTAASYDMRLAGNGTAEVWAARITTGALTLEPAQVEDAVGNEEYSFKAKLTGIAKGVREVRFEYDFGDGSDDATASLTAPVEHATAEVELKHRYAPSPARTEQDQPLTHLLKVKALHQGEVLGEAAAKVTVQQAEVVIQPPRTIVLELDDSTGSTNESFEAVATPPGRYSFEWSFGAGQTLSDRDRSDGRSRVQHLFEDLRPGDVLHPTVRLIDPDGRILASDSITIQAVAKGGAEWVLVDESFNPTHDPLVGNKITVTGHEATCIAERRDPVTLKMLALEGRYSWTSPGHTIPVGGPVSISYSVSDRSPALPPESATGLTSQWGFAFRMRSSASYFRPGLFYPVFGPENRDPSARVPTEWSTVQLDGSSHSDGLSFTTSDGSQKENRLVISVDFWCMGDTARYSYTYELHN